MDTVLGFATTQTAVEFVHIAGFGADDTNVTRHSLRALTSSGDVGADAYEQLAARVWFRMRPVARADGPRVHSVGVTWSHEADKEASLLVEALKEAGFDNVVAVRECEASQELAWARGCDDSSLRKPDDETASLPMIDGATVNGGHPRGSVDGLIQWLDTVVVDDAPASPSGGSQPVTASAAPQAQIALALGAALASANGTKRPEESSEPRRRFGPPGARLRTKSGLLAGGLALLVLLSLGSNVPRLSEQPSQPTQNPRVDPTSGGWAVVPDSSVPHQVQAPVPEPPSIPVLTVTPDVDEVSPAPPAGVVPEPPANIPAPAQVPPVPAPNEQLPPPMPEPPPSEPLVPGRDCVLLCGLVL